LKVYNIEGKEVSKLVDEYLQQGEFAVDFNGNNLSSGVYFYRIKTNDFIENKKMILLK